MHEQDEAKTIALPGFVLDLGACELRDAAGARVPLRPQTQAVLQVLAQQQGRLVGKDALMRAVWPEVVVTDDSLVQCIKELRRVLGDEAHRLIQTAPKRGYRLVLCAPPAVGGAAPAEPAGFEQTIRYTITRDGASIAFAGSGAGPPLVRCAHWMTHLDWDWRSAVFGARIQALSRHFRLWRYDARGAGLSGREAAQATLDEAVLDLEAVVDAAGLERFALFGPSGGAAVAIRYAARHPERVSRLVLLGGFARGASRRGASSAPPAAIEAFARLIEEGWGQDNAAFRQLMTSMLWPGANMEQMASFNQLQRVACAPRAAADLLRRITDFDATADLPQVRCPTLVMHSPCDSRVPFEEGRLIAAMVEGARLEPFDSPNHTPLPDEPAYEQTLRAMIDFFPLGGAGDERPGERAKQAGRAPARAALRVVGGEPAEGAATEVRSLHHPR